MKIDLPIRARELYDRVCRRSVPVFQLGHDFGLELGSVELSKASAFLRPAKLCGCRDRISNDHMAMFSKTMIARSCGKPPSIYTRLWWFVVADMTVVQTLDARERIERLKT